MVYASMKNVRMMVAATMANTAASTHSRSTDFFGFGEALSGCFLFKKGKFMKMKTFEEVKVTCCLVIKRES